MTIQSNSTWHHYVDSDYAYDSNLYETLLLLEQLKIMIYDINYFEEESQTLYFARLKVKMNRH